MDHTNLSDTKTVDWLMKISEIEPYGSAIPGNNYLAFYVVHCVALTVISTSLISCCVVITSIARRLRKENWDFAGRFPLYLAIADFLWGISHFTDHMVLVTSEKYPAPSVATKLSINLWFFLGYQQLMHAALAIYAYLKIVRQYSINLGKGEWKLHALVLAVVSSSVAIFYPLGSFGCSGYWYLQDVKTNEGIALGVYICTSCTIHGLCTTVGYRSIKGVIEAQKKTMGSYSKGKEGQNSSAAECLTTFVIIALCLYCPFAIAYTIFVVESLFGFFEPFTPLVLVIVANSSGWANAFGYFYNNRLKAQRKANSRYQENVPSMSTGSSTA